LNEKIFSLSEGPSFREKGKSAPRGKIIFWFREELTAERVKMAKMEKFFHLSCWKQR